MFGGFYRLCVELWMHNYITTATSSSDRSQKIVIYLISWQHLDSATITSSVLAASIRLHVAHRRGNVAMDEYVATWQRGVSLLKREGWIDWIWWGHDDNGTSLFKQGCLQDKRSIHTTWYRTTSTSHVLIFVAWSCVSCSRLYSCVHLLIRKLVLVSLLKATHARLMCVRDPMWLAT